MEKINLNVAMTCGHCQKRVEGLLSKADGVSAYKVNLADKTVDIDFDATKTSADKLVDALIDLGFDTSIKAS